MFGRSIRFYRLQAGLSPELLAEMVGVSKAAITDFEKGKRTPNAETLEKICRAIKIPQPSCWNFKTALFLLMPKAFTRAIISLSSSVISLLFRLKMPQTVI